MPNENNLLSPITVWSAGRSGTSLLANIFYRHNDVFVVGETFPLIFGVGSILEDQFGNVHERANETRFLTSSERTSQSIRRLFAEEFKSSKIRWMHKPIGLHDTINWRIATRGLDITLSWAKDLFDRTFPESRDILLVRNPCDTVLSGIRYWRYSPAEMAQALLTVAKLHRVMLKPNAFRFRMEGMIGPTRESVLGNLFNYCELDLPENVLDAFSVKHAEYPGSFGKESRENRATVEDFRPRENVEFLLDPGVRKPLSEVYEIYEELHVPYDFENDMERINSYPFE